MSDYYPVEIEYCIDETVKDDFNFLFNLADKYWVLGVSDFKRLYGMDEVLVQDITAYMKSINVFIKADEDFDDFMEYMDDEWTSDDPSSIHRWSTENYLTSDDEIIAWLKQLQKLKGQYWKINQVLVYDRDDEDVVKFELTNDGKIKRTVQVSVEEEVL